MLFLNGRILTGEGLATGSPRFVSALAVEHGLVAGIGSDAELRARFPDATRIDLCGAFAMPGFNDAHLHLGEAARLRREVDLLGTGSLSDALSRIRKAAQAATPGAWLTGGRWDESFWPTCAVPTRHDLDTVTGDHPAVFARIDIHVSVANSAALRLAGVDRHTPDPPGGVIERDAADEPTGLLREAPARRLVEQHIPAATQAQREESLRGLLREMAACGITSVGDNSTEEDVAALAGLHAAGGLTLRISEWLPFDAPLEDLHARRARSPQDRFLRTGMLKAFLDGSLGSRTAALLAPYSDAPQTSGMLLYEPPMLFQMASERAVAGFALGFHAIGDRALALALDTFAAVRALAAAPRLRIEHAQLARVEEIERFKALHVIASVQPSHLLSDLRWVGSRLGPERSSDAYPWRGFLDAGVPLAFGTDLPVEPAAPWRTLYAALTRTGEDGAAAFHPEQCVSLGEALHAYTQGAAYAEGAESWKGRIQPGFVADFVVLDQDLFAIAPQEILKTQVLRTVVDGRTVYLADHAGG